MFRELLLIALFSVALLHPTKYNIRPMETCGDPDNNPAILSWHIHLAYMLTNPTEISDALALRERAREHFKEFLGEECRGIYDEGRLCLIY
jgi:hypothetical protein